VRCGYAPLRTNVAFCTNCGERQPPVAEAESSPPQVDAPPMPGVPTGPAPVPAPAEFAQVPLMTTPPAPPPGAASAERATPAQGDTPAPVTDAPAPPRPDAQPARGESALAAGDEPSAPSSPFGGAPLPETTAEFAGAPDARTLASTNGQHRPITPRGNEGDVVSETVSPEPAAPSVAELPRETEVRLRLGADADGPWVVDDGSPAGLSLVAVDGARAPIVKGTRIRVPDGAAIEIDGQPFRLSPTAASIAATASDSARRVDS
jgi:hypothetical protein